LKVAGIVTDNLNEQMIGVSILEKGTTNACITNIDGDYFLNVKNTGKLMEREAV